MPYIIPTQERINFLIAEFMKEGGTTDAAMITEKEHEHGPYYITEMEDVGPLYLMDEFGEAIKVSWEMFGQYAYIYPPLAALT